MYKHCACSACMVKCPFTGIEEMHPIKSAVVTAKKVHCLEEERVGERRY